MAEIVTVDELKTIEAPEFTNTWSPWPHHVIFEKVDQLIESKGLETIDQRIELSKNGMNMFATKGIKSTNGSVAQIGFRNSMMKSFALGFVAGDFVFVCSNLCFFGSYKQVRVHNASLTEFELNKFIIESVSVSINEHANHMAFIDQMKNIPITDQQFHTLTFEAMRDNIVVPSKFNTFVNGFEEELADQRDYGHGQTLAHFHGAVTRYLRPSSVNTVMDRTMALDNFLHSKVDGQELIEA